MKIFISYKLFSCTSHPCTYLYSHKPAAFASLLTSIVPVLQLPTSTIPPFIHYLLTSFHSLSSADLPDLPPSHHSNQAPLSTSPSLSAKCYFFPIYMVSSTTHLSNLLTFIFNTFIRNSIIFYLLPILTASFSFHAQLHFWMQFTHPQNDPGSSQLHLNKLISLSTASPHLCPMHTVTPNTPQLLYKNLIKTHPSPHQNNGDISLATHKGLLLPPLLYICIRSPMQQFTGVPKHST